MKNRISPSLICMDLCNLENEVKSLENLGCDMLHVDVIDGKFSPDMPIGVETVKQLRKHTNMTFDTHLMATDNISIAKLLFKAGIDRLCFHTEYEPRPNILLKEIKAHGIKAGIAISPETPISSLIHLIELCDFVLVMRIDPGYAHLAGQGVYSFIDDKIKELDKIRKEKGLEFEIEVDGRVGFDDIAPLAEIGVNTFVSGTKGYFSPDNTKEENWKKLLERL